MSLRGHLVRGVAGTLSLTVATAGLTFLNGVLLARLLGVANYGIYAAAIAIVLLLSVPLTLGFDRLLIRDVAASGSRDEWSMAKGLIRRAVQAVVPVSIAAIAILALVAWLTRGTIEDEALPVLWLGLLMIPLLTLTTLRRAVALGLQRIIDAQLPDAVIRPGLFGILLLGALLLLGSGSPVLAMGLNLVSVVVALVFGMLILWRHVPTAMRAATPQFETQRWLREALPFALLLAVHTFINQIDVVLVGSIDGAAAAGLYSVAARGAALALFGALAVNVTLAPTVSQLWVQRDMARLQPAITRAARGAFLFALAVAIALWLGGPQFLLLFGEEFVPASQTLAILAFAQLVDVACGLGGVLLSMTGQQSAAFAAAVAAAVVRVAIDLALIPSLGPSGAAIAAVVSIAVFNGVTAIVAARRLGIDATPFGLFRLRPAA